MGFADVTLIYPWPPQLPRRSVKQRIREPLAWGSFRKADHLVVETEAVKERLASRGIQTSRVSVVPNTCHSVFRAVPPGPRHPLGNEVTLLYVSRAYPHKNHDFLGEVLERLHTRHAMRAKVLVTLTPEEFNSRTTKFHRYALNLGPQTVSQLPALYASVDAAIFPSLLECFSATPLEAMATGTPLLASDHDFNRTVCGEAATYFDSQNPEVAAWQIREALDESKTLMQRAVRGLEQMTSWPDSLTRTTAYLSLIEKAL
ncbi:glycosyltransferase [Ornithinimicrobium pekingense]